MKIAVNPNAENKPESRWKTVVIPAVVLFIVLIGEFIDDLFDHHFLQIHVKTQAADKSEKFQVIAVFAFRHTFESCERLVICFPDRCLHRLDAGFFHLTHFLIKIGQRNLTLPGEIPLADRLEYGFNILYGKNVLKIVDQYQEKNMLLGIFLLDRRRKEIVLCLIINHGFSQDFVIAVSFCR